VVDHPAKPVVEAELRGPRANVEERSKHAPRPWGAVAADLVAGVILLAYAGGVLAWMLDEPSRPLLVLAIIPAAISATWACWRAGRWLS